MNIKNEKELLEKLADLEHDRWSRWEVYRERRLESLSGSVNKMVEQEQNWKRKRELRYDQLTEQEKESDRAEARHTLILLKAHLAD